MHRFGRRTDVARAVERVAVPPVDVVDGPFKEATNTLARGSRAATAPTAVSRNSQPHLH